MFAGQTVGGAPAPAQSAKAPPSEPVAEAAAQPPAPAEKTARGKRGGRKRTERAAAPVQGDGKVDGKGSATSFDRLSLPTENAQVIERLASYRGVGRKSAEATVQAFGEEVFRVLHEQPERVRQTMGARRAEQLLKGWQLDYTQLTGTVAKPSARKRAAPAPSEAAAPAEAEAAEAGARKRRGGTRRGGRKKAARAGK